MPPRNSGPSRQEANFCARYQATCQTLKRVKKGCHACGHDCIQALEDDFQQILTYRRNFRSIPKTAQDRELLWIFGGIESGILSKAEPQPDSQAIIEADAEAIVEVTSETPNEVTSDTPNSQATEGAASSSPRPQEMTSHSSSEGHAKMSSPEHPAMATDTECSAGSPQAREEVTSPSSEMSALVPPPPDAPKAAKRRRRQYTIRRRAGQSLPSIPVQGILTSKDIRICRKAAEFLMGVGPGRVQRVLEGKADGRTKGHRLPNDHPALTSGPKKICLRFLWRKYHFDAEGLPDRFNVERRDASSFTIGAAAYPKDCVVPARSVLRQDNEMGPEAEEIQDQEERAIAAMALYMSSANDPNAMAAMGPGTNVGPARYIGVMRPIHLYMEMEAWCASQEMPKPSFQTFLRALDDCGCIRMRKAVGQHPNCDACTRYKTALRSNLTPAQRVEVMEQLSKHFLANWFDRAVDSNLTESSRTCRRMLDSGQYLMSLARNFSHWFMRCDGVDQAKFRVPRKASKTHAFDKLIRPALHVQGAWCEGFSYHLAVADADMKKDTNNNIEVIARLMESLYKSWGALPLAVSLIQDNTSRECKNQKIVKFAVRLVALDCTESFDLSYPEKGHTHGPLDGTFGQMCVKLSLEEFDDDMDVVEILQAFLRTSGLDPGTREATEAYKLDEAAEWVLWAEQVNLEMASLTGPEAPHYFRICKRKLLGLGGPHADGPAELRASHLADHRGYQPDGEDVVLIVKDRMSSLEVSQIILLVPAVDLPRLRGLELQPQGKHPRRPAADTDRKNVRDKALSVKSEGAISQRACDYLVHWAQGTRRREPRPSHYTFLEYRVGGAPAPKVSAHDLPNEDRAFRPVMVAAIGGAPLPLDEEPDDDQEHGPMIIE